MIQIEKIIPGGQALGTYYDGRKIFFWNALPGEIITDFEITKQKSHYLEAIATTIEQPSPYRVGPHDDCFLSTSPWQIVDFDYELKLKTELVVELFRENHIDIPTPDIFTDGQDYHYRNKMEYALYWDNDTNKISLAFHSRGSHRKFPINQSNIERPEIFHRATEIIEELNLRRAEARRYQSLLLRCNQAGEVEGGLYENHRPHPTFKPLTDQILGHTYSYSPNGFFQINLPVYEMALEAIKIHITTDQVLDLYAGVGTIGLSVARDKHLTLVECDKFSFNEMVKNCSGKSSEPRNSVTRGLPEVTTEGEGASPVTTGASDPSRENTILGSESVRNGNIISILSKSEDVLEYITPYQTIILDPPRSGCSPKLITKLNEVKPETIIYLSCNPATQARDVKLLLDNYQIQSIQTYNFFPHTPHIENLAILQKAC